MSDFIGCVILESLSDESVMRHFRVEDSKDCDAPEGDPNPVWRQRLISIPAEEGERAAERLAAAMGKGYYSHFYDDKVLYVIFKGRYFKLSKIPDASWEPMVAYGETVGVTAHFTRDIPTVRERLLG